MEYESARWIRFSVTGEIGVYLVTNVYSLSRKKYKGVLAEMHPILLKKSSRNDSTRKNYVMYAKHVLYRDVIDLVHTS